MRRFLAALVSLLVAFNFVWVKPVFANIDNSLIRVALSSMGNPISVRFKVEGNYTIQESPSIVLENKEYRVELVNGSLILTDGLVSYPMGAKFTFVRGNGQLRVLNNAYAYGWINYLGNMEIRIVDGGIRFVNYMHLETYLFGVVPYEMSNSWPLEALKAQAVAARTYAMRSMRPSSYYDLYDTDYSQVYKGYNANTGNAIKAVNDTFGKILKFGNTFAGTFYSSSNGGRTEKSKNIFLEDLPYTVIKDDPYDISNHLNSKAFWIVTYNKVIVDLGVQSRLKPYIKASLGARGYSTNDTDINIHSIKELFFNPQNESGRVVSGRIVVILDAKNKSNGQIATIEATVALIQGNIRSILKLDSLLVNLEDAGDAYILRGGGFGHGVGMSQFGAQQMANQGFNYTKILEFYYPGTQLTLLNIAPPINDPNRGDSRPDATPTPDVTSTPDPIPTPTPTSTPIPTPKPTPTPTPTSTPIPTPKPTPTPAPVPKQVVYGKVKVSTTLNVRQGAGNQFGITSTLKNNTEVVICEQSGQWYKIKVGNIQGYVSKDYIVIEQTVPIKPVTPPPVTPTPPKTDTAPPPNTGKTGLVIATTLNIRSGPGTKNHAVGMVVKGKKITILEKTGDWYKITYNGIQGFVNAPYVQVQQTVVETPVANNQKNAVVTASSLNVRSGPGTLHNKVGALTQNSQVIVIETSGGWSKIQKASLVGFVNTNYLKIIQSTQTANKGNTVRKGVVNATSLNMRSGAGTQFKIVTTLLKNKEVEIIEASGQWYKVKFGSTTGYVNGAYIHLQ